MRRLVLLDDAGGRLAALAAGMAALEGAAGFDAVVARGEAPLDPLISAALAEVGLLLPPPLSPAAEPLGNDVVVSIGASPLPGASAHWAAALAPDSALPLVQRAAARTTRDHLARCLAALCAGA